MSDAPHEQLDEEDISALEEIAEWWRESGMTRRAAMGLAGGAALGAATGGGFFAGSANAQSTGQAGQIGTASAPVDVYGEDVYDKNGNHAIGLPGDGSVNIDELSNVFDYIVGTGDNLKDIIDNQLSDGESVFVGPGTHTVTNDNNTSILTVQNNDVTIHLHSGAVIKLGDNQIDDSNRANVIRIGDGTTAYDNVTITGEGKIDWNESGGNGGSFTSLGTDNAAILVDGPCENIKLTDFGVVDADTVPIWVEGAGSAAADRAKGVAIDSLDLTNVGKGPLWQYANFVRCSGIYLDTTDASAATENGIEAGQYTDHWQIVDNRVVDTDHAGIYVYNSTGRRGVISGNTLLRCGQTKSAPGIHIGPSGESEHLVISENSIVSAGAQGIDYHGLSHSSAISNNIVIDSGDHSYHIRGGGGGSDLTILGNIALNSAGNAFTVEDGAETTIIAFNQVDAGSNGNWGVNLASGLDNCFIGFNYFRNCSIGVDIVGNDNRLLHNTFESCTTNVDDTGTRTRRNGVGAVASSGAPTASNWDAGDIVEDTNNPGDLYIKKKNGSFEQFNT